MYDASYPLIKRGVCLRHHRNICNALAPPDRHTDKTPALWATLGPLRDYLVPHGPAWVQQHTNYAIYLHHYLTYQLQMGINGVIYYGNAWSLGLLQQQSVLHTYLRDGTLRWVANGGGVVGEIGVRRRGPASCKRAWWAWVHVGRPATSCVGATGTATVLRDSSGHRFPAAGHDL